MTHTHSIPLSSGSVSFSSDLGEIVGVSSQQLPILKNLSLRKLTLAPGSIREPHWHPNAVELGYCIAGHALVGILGNADAFASFTISAGQMFHIRSGAITISRILAMTPRHSSSPFDTKHPKTSASAAHWVL